jgi:hypothetical protein
MEGGGWVYLRLTKPSREARYEQASPKRAYSERFFNHPLSFLFLSNLREKTPTRRRAPKASFFQGVFFMSLSIVFF